MSALELLAPAKINLFLHVGLPGADGFHPICSLMVFADIGDRLSLAPSDRFEMELAGPFGGGLSGGEDNLVLRAARALSGHLGGGVPPMRLRLDKQLPVAAGLGGGSSDAGAALRLLRQAWAPDLPDRDLETVAASLGSDGAACLWARTVLAEGRGEVLSPAPRLPVLHAVLVNPGCAVSTPQVYRQFDALDEGPRALQPDLPMVFSELDDLVEALGGLRNDLEAPAIALAPEVGEVLKALKAQPETRFVRMSGSGATCFALCETAGAAQAVAKRLLRAHPTWWVRACQLGMD